MKPSDRFVTILFVIWLNILGKQVGKVKGAVNVTNLPLLIPYIVTILREKVASFTLFPGFLLWSPLLFPENVKPHSSPHPDLRHIISE